MESIHRAACLGYLLCIWIEHARSAAGHCTNDTAEKFKNERMSQNAGTPVTDAVRAETLTMLGAQSVVKHSVWIGSGGRAAEFGGAQFGGMLRTGQ